MIDRYAGDALACYGRLRQLDERDARAELAFFDRLLASAAVRREHEVREDVRACSSH
jgi:hypothetical protein